MKPADNLSGLRRVPISRRMERAKTPTPIVTVISTGVMSEEAESELFQAILKAVRDTRKELEGKPDEDA